MKETITKVIHKKNKCHKLPGSFDPGSMTITFYTMDQGAIRRTTSAAVVHDRVSGLFNDKKLFSSSSSPQTTSSLLPSSIDHFPPTGLTPMLTISMVLADLQIRRSGQSIIKVSLPSMKSLISWLTNSLAEREELVADMVVPFKNKIE